MHVLNWLLYRGIFSFLIPPERYFTVWKIKCATTKNIGQRATVSVGHACSSAGYFGVFGIMAVMIRQHRFVCGLKRYQRIGGRFQRVHADSVRNGVCRPQGWASAYGRRHRDSVRRHNAGFNRIPAPNAEENFISIFAALIVPAALADASSGLVNRDYASRHYRWFWRS